MRSTGENRYEEEKVHAGTGLVKRPGLVLLLKMMRTALYGLISVLAATVLTHGLEYAEADTSLYRSDDVLYVQRAWVNEPILHDVVDYDLVSLDGETQHLLVLHGERSTEVDMDGYDNALEAGHNVGGYLRFYEVTNDDCNSSNILPGNIAEEFQLEQFYESDFTLVNPWCIDAGDMDGDGCQDIFIGAYRATEFYEADRRPYLLEWNGDYLKRKWTGSYLNMKTYYEAGFEDMDGDGLDELYAIQPSGDGSIAKYFYRFGYFSFDQVGVQ